MADIHKNRGRYTAGTASQAVHNIKAILQTRSRLNLHTQLPAQYDGSQLHHTAVCGNSHHLLVCCGAELVVVCCGLFILEQWLLHQAGVLKGHGGHGRRVHQACWIPPSCMRPIIWHVHAAILVPHSNWRLQAKSHVASQYAHLCQA